MDIKEIAERVMTPEEIKTLGHAYFDGKTLQYEEDNGAWCSNVITVTRNIKRLYGTEEKTNP